MTRPRRPLIVRLRNWVGDVVLAVPMLQRLADAGFDLQLLGKGWARDLLAGQGWPIQVLPGTSRERVAVLRQLKHEARASGTQPVQALCLPDSFSSALEFRLAGLPALGHAWEGRRLLLAQAVSRPPGVHELDVYWQLGNALLGQAAPLPTTIGLRLAPQHLAQAHALREAHGLPAASVFICPFAGGTWNQADKTWPAFADFVAQELIGMGRTVVVCPGPGDEEAIARQAFPQARLLAGVGLGTYAALLRDAALLLSNDTGPGHLAAAVGAPVISVMGPSDPRLWHPWGPDVQVLGGHGAWPLRPHVRQAVEQRLAQR